MEGLFSTGIGSRAGSASLRVARIPTETKSTTLRDKEFQTIVDHRQIVWSDPVGAIARLQLGRAWNMASDSAKSKAAYEDFLMLWKNADPDIPILKQAKAEIRQAAVSEES